MTFNIGKNLITNTAKTYFIAEIGSNFDGNIDRAKELIKLAKESGADAAKFQHYTASSLVNQSGFNDLNIKSHQSSWSGSVHEIYNKASLNVDWTKALYEECQKYSIDFMTSPYSVDLLNQVIKYIPAIKIGSGDITYHEIIEEMSKYSKPILLATGASSFNEVEMAMNLIYGKVPVCLMQCNTNYESDPNHDVFQNIRVISSYKKRWPNAILGISCHMKEDIAVMAAISLGARIVEKHFTDDDNREGPDHKFALNPNEFKNMVSNARKLEKILGDGIKKVEENERNTKFLQRRSLVINKKLKSGSIIKNDDIDALRPFVNGAYEPYKIDLLIGRELKIDVEKGHIIKDSDFKI